MSSAFVLLLTLSSLTAALPRDNIETTSSSAFEKRYNVERPLPHPVEDPSILKYQISGIVGAYALWTLVTVILIVIVRSRLRQRDHASEHSVTMTMMKTFHGKRDAPIAIETTELKSPESLKSPSKLQGFKSWGRKSHKNLTSTYSTATMASTQSHEQHKAQDMNDLSALYAAVMARDEERSQENSPILGDEKSPLSPGYPPEFAHLQAASADRDPLRSPGFSQPLKSPGFGMPLKSPGLGQRLHHPLAPTPTVDAFPSASPYYDPNIPSRNTSRSSRTTPMSINSETGSIAGSLASPRHRPAKISIRGQDISQPIGSADLRNAQYYDETVPLSPRLYNPGPPPPVPGNRKKQVQVSVDPIDEDSPTDQYPYYQEEITQAPPMPTLPRSIVPTAQTQTTQPIREKRAPPSALALRSDNKLMLGPGSAAPVARVLPFRDMYGDSSLRSAPPTKTTFLERPVAQSTAPRTGVPYSPYVPNTPMTPITPRKLMNRQELRARRKEERLKPLNEDDMVAGDDDMWGK